MFCVSARARAGARDGRTLIKMQFMRFAMKLRKMKTNIHFHSMQCDQIVVRSMVSGELCS